MGWAGSHDNQSTVDLNECMRRLARKYRRKTTHALASSTLEDKLQNNEMPPGGLEQVEEEVMRTYERLIAVDLGTLSTTAMKKEFYLRFLGMLMTALCVRVSQGRILVRFYTKSSSSTSNGQPRKGDPHSLVLAEARYQKPAFGT